MLWYAPYAGEWSDYHGEYRWQRLGGNHDALGDCRAVLELLQRAAANQGAIDAHRRLQESVRGLQRQWGERGTRMKSYSVVDKRRRTCYTHISDKSYFMIEGTQQWQTASRSRMRRRRSYRKLTTSA
jgi:hypothetical protein